jgi:tetratricopeptide (TPR) repeat protein
MMNENGVHFDKLYEIYKNCYTEDSILDLKEHLKELTHYKIIDHHFYNDHICLQSSIYESVMHKALEDRRLTSSLSFYFDKHLNFDHEKVQDLAYLNTYRLNAPHIEGYLQNHKNLVTNKVEINLRAKLAEIYYYCMGDMSYFDLNLKRCDNLLNDADMEDPAICSALHILGHLYYDSDRWTQAQNYYLKSMEIQNLALDSSLGRCYYNLGMIYKKKVNMNKAKKYFGIASKIYEEELPGSSQKLAYSYDHLGYIYKILADKRVKNDVFVQFDHLKESPVVEELANSYISLGNMHYAIEDFPSSEMFYNECLDLYRRELPPDHPDIASIYTNLGCIYDSRGDHNSAERCYMLALEIYEKILQPNHPYLATIYNNLGVLYFSKKDLENAQKYLLMCKDIRENLHINQTSTSEPKFGNSYKSMRDYEKAEYYYDKSLKMYEYTGKTHDWELTAAYCALGDIHFSKREYKKAIEAYEACKNIFEIHSPDRMSDISEIYIKLGIMYEMKGNLEKAKECFKQSLNLHFNSSDPDNLNTATAYNHLASIHSANKNYNKARTLYDKSFQITSSLINHESRLSFYNAEIAGHSARALEKLSKYHISSQFLNDSHVYASLANVYLNLGSLFFSQQDYERSEEFYMKHLDLYQQLAPNSHEQFAKAYNNLGNLYYDQGDYDRAEEYYAKCKEIYENETFSQGVNLATVYNNLGSLYLTKGDTEIAQQYYVKSQTIREKVLLPTHEDLLSTRENLDMIVSPTI